MSKHFKTYKTIIIILLVLLITAALVYWIKTSSPDVDKKDEQQTAQLLVEVITPKREDYTVIIDTFGQIQASTQTMLSSQVNGQIIEVSEKLADGEFFKKGQVLLKVDPRDYESQLQIAQAQLAQANAQLIEENARSAQAAKDWVRLGQKGAPSDLVLRKPQLNSAQANVASARANVQEAQIDLERTEIIAPYDGRVMAKQVDIGQSVSQGTQLVDIYATDYAEVALPLTSQQLGMLAIDLKNKDIYAGQQATIETQYGNVSFEWPAKIVRSMGSFDAQSRQLSLIAVIDDPYFHTEKSPGLFPGQFISAKIKGRTFEDAFIVPSSAVYLNQFVFVVENDRAYRKDVNVLWQDQDFSIIDDSLIDVSALITTPMNQQVSGTRVKIINREEADPSSTNISTQIDPANATQVNAEQETSTASTSARTRSNSDGDKKP